MYYMLEKFKPCYFLIQFGLLQQQMRIEILRKTFQNYVRADNNTHGYERLTNREVKHKAQRLQKC